jgi:hypothetical protein
MRCIWCNTPNSYYLTVENSMRQNCRVSDNGYHDFQSNSSLARCFRYLFGFAFARQRMSEYLIEHRREKRPNTI